jgi:hypothetical protein
MGFDFANCCVCGRACVHVRVCMITLIMSLSCTFKISVSSTMMTARSISEVEVTTVTCSER